MDDKPMTFVGATSADVLDKLIGSTEPVESGVGRLIATGLPEIIDAWSMAEAERGSPPVATLAAFLNVMVSLFARVAYIRVHPKSYKDLPAAVSEFTEQIPDIMAGYQRADNGEDIATPVPVNRKPSKGPSPWLTQQS